MASIEIDLSKITNDITGYINELIKTVSLEGGGKIIFPKGTYNLGTIEIRDNITLYLEKGAILKAKDSMDYFPPIGYHHNEMGDVTSFIFGMNCSNFSIEGQGIIDLNGTHWFDSDKPAIPTSTVLFTQEQIDECTWTYKERVNQPIFFYKCSKISIQGITIINSPCWTITLANSSLVSITNITILNHPNIPNNDGIHICASKQIRINNCFMECADDCIAVSSIIDWNIPSEDIIISDCQFKSHSKALVLGYMQSIVKNVTIQNIIIRESNRGLCIMSSEGDGLVENVVVSNCIIETKIRAGNWWGNGEPIFLMGTYHHGYSQNVDRSWPINIKNITFSNITCQGENAIGIIGKNKNIEDITLRDIKYTRKDSKNLKLKGNIFCLQPSSPIETIPQDNKKYGLVIRDAANIVVENVKLNCDNSEDCYSFMEVK